MSVAKVGGLDAAAPFFKEALKQIPISQVKEYDLYAGLANLAVMVEQTHLRLARVEALLDSDGDAR